MATASGEMSKSHSARHQIPIALTRALTHHKAQGMSLDQIYVKLYNTSASGVSRLHNNFGILYTAVNRCKDPIKKLLIERFGPEVLGAIANSNAMKAMQVEFEVLKKKNIKTDKWARPLLSKFDELFDEAQHCRKSTVVVVQPPVSPEKAVQVMTKASKNSSRQNHLSASTRDYHHSRKEKVPKRCPPPPFDPRPKKKAKKARGARRNRVKPQKKRIGRTTRESRKKKSKTEKEQLELDAAVGEQRLNDLLKDAVEQKKYGDCVERVLRDAANRR